MPSLWNLRSILESAGLGIGLSIIGNALIAAWNGAKAMDVDLHNEVQSREAVITMRDQAIKQRDEIINSLSAPKRTRAEQDDYDTVKRALKLVGTSGIAAVRHLRRQGSLSFNHGGCGGPLPPGQSMEQALWAYRHCASEGVLSQEANFGNTGSTFSIKPHMEKVLAEALYEDENPVTA